MNSIVSPAAPTAEPWIRRYALCPSCLLRLGGKGDHGVWATHGLLSLCSGFSESTLLLSQKKSPVASGVGGRRKMMLGAASQGPAHRRPGQDGRFPTHRVKGSVRQPPWRRSSPFSGTALLTPMGEGSRKGDLKKACLTSILSEYRS